MCCNARSQASPSDLPTLKHETVHVAASAWSTIGTTTTPKTSPQSNERSSAIINCAISLFVFGNFSISVDRWPTFPSGLVVPMLVQQTGDLPPEFFGVQQVAHGARVVEQLPLKFLRDVVPLHDDRSSEATQDVLLFGSD